MLGLLLSTILLASPSGDPTPCGSAEGEQASAGLPAPDLYCIPLLAGPAGGAARGEAHLLPAPTPFGIAVTRDGLPRLRIRIRAEGLPEPEALGPYVRLVAWLTPPTLRPMIPLGTLEDGVLETTVPGFNTYLILISAEQQELPGERTGPLVLRGSSPSMVLRPHDMAYILAEMSSPSGLGHTGHGGEPPPGPARPHDGAHPHRPSHHHGETALTGGETEWINPPMHPFVSMPHQIMELRPGVEPFLPRGGASEAEAAAPPPLSRPRETIRLADGDTLHLTAGPLRRKVGRVELPGYGFNGQSPGPLIEAEENATVHIRFRNDTPIPSAVHWHGIRLDAASDGVPGVTQDPVLPGREFLYHLRLPDEGTFWYHPHLREDVAQDLGLAGNLRVRPATPEERYAVVHQEVFLLLDDHLVTEDGRTVPYGREAPTHVLMGRFGNVLLANGSDRWAHRVRAGEVVRFHLTNAANTRTFNLSFGELPMKLVASDLGKLPREAWVESVVLAPAERWVVEVRFPEEGSVALENRVQALDHVGARFFLEVDTVATVHVDPSPASSRSDGTLAPGPSGPPSPDPDPFERLRTVPDLVREVEAVAAAHRHLDPHHTLVLDLRTRDLPFPLDPLLIWEGIYRPPVEWAGTMPDMDWLVTGVEAEWILRDADSGAENLEIDWRFRRGDRVRLRLVNSRDSLHPMQHPIHLHGQRFLVLSVNGEATDHPAWKDTVLVPVGTVVDLLVELDNPGPWMLHCHIAEHLESGMMTVLRVDP
jgi:suppressor of ftsI